MHKGHIAAAYDLKSRVDTLLFVLGSTNVCNADNPTPADKREAALRLVCEREGWNPVLLGIERIADTHDDRWGQGILHLLERYDLTPSEVLARGNTQWTRDVLQTLNIAVYEGDEVNRADWQGNVIREKIRSGDSSWQEAYPEYLWSAVHALIHDVVEAPYKVSYCNLV